MPVSRSTSLPSSPSKPALRPGALRRLLQPPDPSDDESAPRRPRGPAVLQVTNITPALSGADPFSGHHGFYLRLSDSAHSCYVSLHADHDDLILADGLHIGQLIEVHALVPSIPAPVLRMFRVLPGRYPCVQQDDADDPDCSSIEIKEIVSSSVTARPLRAPTPPLPERKVRSSAGSAPGHQRSRSIQSLAEIGIAAATKRRDVERRSTEVLRKLRKISVTSADDNTSGDESDVSSPYTSSSFPSGATAAAARRSWDFSGSIKDIAPVSGPRRSASVSPSRSGQTFYLHRSDAAHDQLEAVRKKAETAFKVLSKRHTYGSNKTFRSESSCMATQQSSSSSIKWSKNNVTWSSLSSNLARHGKEAVKQKDMALQDVLDGLLEASTTEKLIKCLSVYSELQSDKDDDPKEIIDRFLQFYKELDEAIFVVQSQARLRHMRTGSSNPTSSAATKAAVRAALDRKQHAISWIRAALEADLSPVLAQTKATSESTKAPLPDPNHVSVTPLFSCCSKPRCTCSHKHPRKASDASSSDGGGLNAAMDLANALRLECNRWFLKYADKFLDAIDGEADCATTCDSQIASLLHQLKRVDDWLNRVARHDRSIRDSSFSEEEEMDACERVRRKIYGALLRHVQYAAMALESMTSVSDEEKEQE